MIRSAALVSLRFIFCSAVWAPEARAQTSAAPSELKLSTSPAPPHEAAKINFFQGGLFALASALAICGYLQKFIGLQVLFFNWTLLAVGATAVYGAMVDHPLSDGAKFVGMLSSSGLFFAFGPLRQVFTVRISRRLQVESRRIAKNEASLKTLRSKLKAMSLEPSVDPILITPMLKSLMEDATLDDVEDNRTALVAEGVKVFGWNAVSQRLRPLR